MAGNHAKLIAQLKAIENIPWVAPVAAAETIADLAREKAAVDTGEMKSKIQAKHLSKYSQVVAGAKHSGYVEFGTYKMKAQPFLRPALDEGQRQILAAVSEAMVGEMEVAVRGGWVPNQYVPGRYKHKKKR